MKVNKLILSVLCVLFFQSLIVSGQTNKNDAVVVWLKDFYSHYMTEMSKMPPNSKYLDNLESSHCTKQLLSKLKNEDYDYDPFLNAQDIDLASVKSLSIKKSSDNAYIVSYTAANKKIIHVKVFVMCEKNKYSISGLR